MINKRNPLKALGPAMLALLLLLLYLLPVKAIGGSDIKLSGLSAGGPDIEMSADNNRLAVVYYKQSNTGGSGAIYLKSATQANGWVTSNFVSFGSNPQLAFKRGANNVVYVAWAKGDGTAIQAARCTLNPTTAPTCGAARNVLSLTLGNLSAPDIVVDGGNYLHVAWQNGDNIQTTRSTNPDSVSAWLGPTTPSSLCSGNKASAPVLGYTSPSNKLHLAFLCGAVASTPTSIQYRRSSPGSHNWIDAKAFVKGPDINDLNSKLGDLALHATGSQVSLAWDGLRTDGSQEFSLMYATSTNEGSNWGTASYVPSGNPATSGVGLEKKLSTTSTVPPQEYGLRPSLVISGTAGNAAVVWQERLGTTCAQANNSSSDIHYVDPQVQASPAISQTLEHGKTEYSIDPDLAVETGGRLHFVFMKDNAANNCTGGDAPNYAIYYRGPFTIVTHDKGETGGGLYLSVIRK